MKARGIRTRRPHWIATVLACVVAIASAQIARAANVDITLSPAGVSPDPANIATGDTVTFSCDSNCLLCEFVSASGSILGISPFIEVEGSGATSSPLGPAAAAGSVSFHADDPGVCGLNDSQINATGAALPALHGPTGFALLVLFITSVGLAAVAWRRRATHPPNANADSPRAAR